MGIAPLAFADNSAPRWNTLIDGVEVLSPANAAARFGSSATFVITIWGAGSPHRMADSLTQLAQLGVTRACTFAPLYWKLGAAAIPYYGIDLPHHVLEQKADVRRAMSLMHDERSRAEFAAQLRMRLHGDFDGLSARVADTQYFPSDVYGARDDERVVDCGAFDGDTLLSFLRERHGRFSKYVALEPDPVSLRALRGAVGKLDEQLRARVTLVPLAAYSSRTTLHLSATGTAASNFTTSGDPLAVSIECAPLDEIAEAGDATFIKMDIEGAELHAMAGARQLIARERPVLAISAYHVQDHLWRVPLAIQSMYAGYRLFLRPHNEQGWDLVCYAVPSERLVSPGSARD